MAKKKQNISATETKAERFIRVVSSRMDKALKIIRLLGLCSSSNYEYTDQQVVRILKELHTAIEHIGALYSKAPKAKEAGFKF